MKAAQYYYITHAFSLVMKLINKREVDDPNNERVIIALDETKALLKISGFSEIISDISQLYRSRATEIMVIIQGLWQLLDENLRKQIWSMGSVLSFRRDDNLEAETIARQLWNYDNHYVRYLPKTDSQNPTTESAQGQDRMRADFIQNLKPRQFVMRRYRTESEKEQGVQFVRKTTDMPKNEPYITVPEIMEYLIKRDGVPIREAINAVVARTKKDKQDSQERETL